MMFICRCIRFIYYLFQNGLQELLFIWPPCIVQHICYSWTFDMWTQWYLYNLHFVKENREQKTCIVFSCILKTEMLRSIIMRHDSAIFFLFKYQKYRLAFYELPPRNTKSFLYPIKSVDCHFMMISSGYSMQKKLMQ